MTSADVRDMLDLPTDGQPRPAKKQKVVEKRPEGITRELFALLGERAPPVAITDHVRYRERRKWPQKVEPWEWTPFTNPARTDGLVLQHWRKKQKAAQPPIEDVNADGTNVPKPLDGAGQQAGSEPAYHYAKFNVKVKVPEYTDEEYERHLKDGGWSKGETDYLMELAADYDLRWVVIADRYSFKTDVEMKDLDQAEAAATQPNQRSMEEMKARYYAVAARVMTLRQPLSSMSSAELGEYEKMIAFDPIQETQRKRMAEALMSRAPEEVKEEEVLLAELKRIVSNQDRLMEERKELYARLEAPKSTANTQAYQSSQGLAQLLQSLLVADKGKKRRSMAGPGETPTSAGPSTGGFAAGPSSAQKDGRDGGRRDSVGGTAGSANKKGAPQPERRHLTPQEEDMYGVAHHERLTSGVQFRHDRAMRHAQAKSNIQAQRVSNALAELGIPPRLVMPTAKICSEYEKLMQSIHTLIEIRKVSEKIEGETKVATAVREERERRESQTQIQLQQQANSQADQSANAHTNEDTEMADAPGVHGETGTTITSNAPAETFNGSHDPDRPNPSQESDASSTIQVLPRLTTTSATARPSFFSSYQQQHQRQQQQQQQQPYHHQQQQAPTPSTDTVASGPAGPANRLTGAAAGSTDSQANPTSTAVLPGTTPPNILRGAGP